MFKTTLSDFFQLQEKWSRKDTYSFVYLHYMCIYDTQLKINVTFKIIESKLT